MKYLVKLQNNGGSHVQHVDFIKKLFILFLAFLSPFYTYPFYTYPTLNMNIFFIEI